MFDTVADPERFQMGAGSEHTLIRGAGVGVGGERTERVAWAGFNPVKTMKYVESFVRASFSAKTSNIFSIQT